MLTHHRHKQRTLSVIVFLLIFTVATDVYFILSPAYGLEAALLFAFTVAIGLTVTYQCYNYRHSHEHHVMLNTLTQIYLGTILFACCVLILLLHAFLGLDILDGYIILSLIVLLLTFLSLGHFEEWVTHHMGRKFKASTAPKPKARKKRRK